MLRSVVECEYTRELRAQIGTVFCGEVYSSLILVYVPCAVLGVLLLIPTMQAIKGIKRFNRDYWKQTAAHQRPPGRYTIGRRKYETLRRARDPLADDDAAKPLRPKRGGGGAAARVSVFPFVGRVWKCGYRWFCCVISLTTTRLWQAARPKSAQIAQRALGDGKSSAGNARPRVRPKSEHPAAREKAAGKVRPASGVVNKGARPDEAKGPDRALRMSSLKVKRKTGSLKNKRAKRESAARESKQIDTELAEIKREQDAKAAAAALASKPKKAADKSPRERKGRTATDMVTSLPKVGDIEPSGRYEQLDGDIGDDIMAGHRRGARKRVGLAATLALGVSRRRALVVVAELAASAGGGGVELGRDFGRSPQRPPQHDEERCAAVGGKVAERQRSGRSERAAVNSAVAVALARRLLRVGRGRGAAAVFQHRGRRNSNIAGRSCRDCQHLDF